MLKLSQYPIPHAATVWSLASSVALGLGRLWYGSGPDRTRRFCGGEQVDALHAQLLLAIATLFDRHKHALGWGHKTMRFV